MARREGLRGSILVAVALAAFATRPAPLHAEGMPLTVRITSPLGRTGLPGPIRIVAQVSQTREAPLGPVQFFVDGTLIGEDVEGPAYAIEWIDENPFVEHRIGVGVVDGRGHTATDLVTLAPLEIVDEARVASVLVEATVQDAGGQFVAGLPPADFTLFEDHIEQTLGLVQQETAPITMTLLVDSSQSMQHRFDVVRRAAARFASHLGTGDRLIVAPFSRGLGAVTGPTADAETVAGAIDAMRPHGGTAIVDSLKAAAERLDRVEGRHAIVLITDGYDEHSRGSVEKALAAVRKTRATLYTVGIGGAAGISIRGKEVLEQLAEEGGGRAFFPFRDEELPLTCARVIGDVRNRYLLSYTPRNQELDGKWRAIELVVADPALRVRARRGYFAPTPPPVRATLEFTVTERRGGYADIALDDLVVIEDDVPQRLDTFQEAVAPISILLLFDASGSMKSATDVVKRAGRAFIDALRPEDSVGVMQFGSSTEILTDMSMERAPAVHAIDRYAARGGTALYDALAEALTRLASVEGRRVVVLLTDGKDENAAGDGPGSRRSLDEVVPLLERAGATVYAVGLGSSVDTALLERLAQASGGEALFAEETAQLDTHYRRILEALRRRYVVGYTSTNATRNGAWRTVEIRTRRPQLLVRGAGGYFAPER